MLAGSQGLKPTVVEGTAMQFNASDYASFYYKDIPVIFTFTGTHADYHRPSDDTPRVNFEGMARIANYAELILLDLARRPTRPAFVKLKGGSSPGPLSASRGSGVYLGTRPAYGAEVTVDLQDVFSVLENAPEQAAAATEIATELLGADKVEANVVPKMGSEDFADMTMVVPGAYVWLGAAPGPGLHNAGYNFDDSIIPVGSAFLARMVERRTAA